MRLLGNPAIDAGANNCPATDQRSVSWSQNAHCDIGATEIKIDMLYMPMVTR